MAVRSTNTYSEGLQALIQDIASLQLAPDANVEFLLQIQQMIIGEAQAPVAAATAAGPPIPGGSAVPAPPVGAPPPGMPPGGPEGGPPPGLAALLGVGGPGGGSSPLPRSDTQSEMARMLA